MLEKDMYDSWKSRMELYMLNHPHDIMILEAVEQGPLIWPSVEVEGKEETLREFYLRFSLLLNDMNMYNMKLEQFQVKTKFLNTLPSEWSNQDHIHQDKEELRANKGLSHVITAKANVTCPSSAQSQGGSVMPS
nr:hypothetical protein [Tanacetum cinerariifolium]